METKVRKEISFDVNQQFSNPGCPHFLVIVMFFCSLFVTFISSSFDYGTLVPKYGVIFQLASILWSNHPLVIGLFSSWTPSLFTYYTQEYCSCDLRNLHIYLTSQLARNVQRFSQKESVVFTHTMTFLWMTRNFFAYQVAGPSSVHYCIINLGHSSSFNQFTLSHGCYFSCFNCSAAHFKYGGPMNKYKH